MESIATGRHFIFGIGSVMNAHSRRVQFPDAVVIPCVAKGLRRGWWMCYDFHPINKDLPKSGLYDVVRAALVACLRRGLLFCLLVSR